MFSGKSDRLLREMSRYEAIGMPILLVNSALDSRTDNSVKTHNDVKKTAVKVHRLAELLSGKNLVLYKAARVIGIDEAQFFEDLHAFVLQAEKDSKTVIIAGLDGDSERRPFGQILECIPLCDSVTKLHAMDMVDKDGTAAIFTKRLVPVKEQICIGDAGQYLPVSRKNYLKS